MAACRDGPFVKAKRSLVIDQVLSSRRDLARALHCRAFLTRYGPWGIPLWRQWSDYREREYLPLRSHASLLLAGQGLSRNGRRRKGIFLYLNPGNKLKRRTIDYDPCAGWESGPRRSRLSFRQKCVFPCGREARNRPGRFSCLECQDPEQHWWSRSLRHIRFAANWRVSSPRYAGQNLRLFAIAGGVHSGKPCPRAVAEHPYYCWSGRAGFSAFRR